MLVVEVDGGYHDYLFEDDKLRQKYIEEQGWRVLRYSNEEINADVEAVAISIARAMGMEPHFKPRVKVCSGMRMPRKKR